MNFGQWLKQEREARGWSQEEMGERMGARHSSISRLETGKTGVSENMLGRCVAVLSTLLLPGQTAEGIERAARLARAGASEPVQTVKDSGGRVWRVLERLGDPTSPFVLTPEAAAVLAALKLLEPDCQPVEPEPAQDNLPACEPTLAVHQGEE